ncbi:class I SAM-dependent methyltransferase [Psychromonas sp. SR45-3]|uniref:class I SAM-dependent methyltransferase n=1 Tax=Psychromonas sp. SR45-3 TaxID=2760930 RepID=UPI0015F855DB|nr:class I SAM-dependent methyltransferase [Psychromonas sp. SR45-3]MBB1271632.1 class I SAM-dependent methyltransferase [Psychromonas sp. SR45-3]
MQFNWKKINIKNNNNDAQLLTYRSCPICQHQQATTVLTFNNFQFFSDSESSCKQATIQEQQCQKCNAIFLNPCYSTTGFNTLFSEAGQSYGSTLQRPLEQFNWIKDRINVENTSFMDIGCGIGSFIASLPKNINKIGIDIDEQSISTAQKNNPDILFLCSPFEMIEYNNKIDIITMFHVLEHLQDPLQTLKRLHTLSNTNTKFIIEIPILENGLTNDINGFFSAQHLTHFSRNSFKNILAASGWEVIEWEEQQDYNGCRVIVEKGLVNHNLSVEPQEKKYLYNYMQNWYMSLAKAEEKLLAINTPRCVIWGGGMHLEFIYQISTLFSKEIEFIIVDKDKNKQGKTWRGIDICSPDIISNLMHPEISYIASSYRNQNIIKDELLQYGVEENKIITLYDHINVY